MPAGRDSWGFVHYTLRDAPGPIASDTSETESGADKVDDELDLGEGKVYDLKGFLECMAREGRSMPTEDAVNQLEDILFAKDPKTGAYRCPLMTQDQVSSIDVSWMPLRYQDWFAM